MGSTSKVSNTSSCVLIYKERCCDKAEAIRQEIEKTGVSIDGSTLHLTFSIGCAYKGVGLSADIDDMLREADDSVYAAKEIGRNRVMIAA